MLDALVSKAISHGAYGAKLTGAGGGGCIISLTEYNGRLLEAFKDNDPFISGIEDEGIKIINNLQS
jgi:mevalonate kinase